MVIFFAIWGFLLLFLKVESGEITDDLRLNEIQVLGTHNSYHVQPNATVQKLYELFEVYLGTNSAPAFQYSHVSPFEQLEKQNVRSFEFDIAYDPLGENYNEHQVMQLLLEDPKDPNIKLSTPGYKVLHLQDIDYESNCILFTDCLMDIQRFLDLNPNTVPITILLEVRTPDNNAVKDPFNLGFAIPLTPDMDELEAEILSVFPREQILTPNDVIGNEINLRTAVLTNGWPTIGNSKGKVMFWLTTDLNYTIDATSLLFPAVRETSVDAGVMLLTDPDEVTTAVKKGYLVRTRCDVETQEARSGNTTRRDNAIASGAQIISTDYPGPILPGNLLPEEITSGYVVDLPETCNPILVDDCEITSQPLAQLTEFIPLTGEAVFDYAGDFITDFKLDNRTRDLLQGLSKLLGLHVPTPFSNSSSYIYTNRYTPPGRVNAMHNFPRPGSPTDFEVNNSEYWIGLAGIGIAFIAVSLIFIIASYFWFFKCCCRCRKSRFSSKHTNPWPWVISASVFLGIAILGCLMALIGEVNFADALNETNDVFKGLQDLFQRIFDLVDAVPTVTSEMSTGIVNASQICPTILSNQTEAVTNVLREIGQFSAELASTIEPLIGNLNDISSLLDDINKAQQSIIYLFVVFMMLIVFAFIVAFVMSPAINKRIRNYSVRTCLAKWVLIPLCVICVFIIIVVMTLVIIIMVTLSDFCQAPDTYVSTIVDVNASDFVEAFAVCDSTSSVVQFFTEGGNGGIILAAAELRPLYNLSSLMCPDDISAMEYTKVLYNNVAIPVEITQDLIWRIFELISCGSLTNIYDTLVHQILCTTTTEGMIFVWVGLMLIAISMAVLVWCFGALTITATNDFPKGYEENPFETNASTKNIELIKQTSESNSEKKNKNDRSRAPGADALPLATSPELYKADV